MSNAGPSAVGRRAIALVVAGAAAGLAVPSLGVRSLAAPILVASALVVFLAPAVAGIAVVATVIVGGWNVARVATPFPGLYLVDAAGLVAAAALVLRYPWLWTRWRFGIWYFVFVAACFVPLALNTGGASLAYGIRAFAFAYYPIFALSGMAAMAVLGRAKAAWIMGIAICAAIPIALLLDSSQVTLTTTGSRRYIGGMYGGFGAMALPLALHLANRSSTRVHGVAAGVASLALILLSSHRSAWLAGLCALVAAWALTRERRVSPGAVAGFTLVVVLFFAGTELHLIPIDTHAQLDRAVSLVGSADDPNVQNRVERWSLAIEAAAKGGFVGEGYFTEFPTPSIATRPGPPHNIWVTVFFRGGLAGVVLYTVMLARALITKDVGDDDRPLHAAIAGAVIGGIVFSTFNVTLENPYYAPVVWFAVGAAMALRAPQPAPTPSRRLLVRDGRVEHAAEAGFVGGGAPQGLAVDDHAGRAP